MRQMPMTTEMTTLHRTSPLAWHCTLSTLTSTFTECAHARIVSSASYTSSILTLAQVLHLSASPSSTCHPCVRPLHLELLSLLPSFPPVLLPLPFLLPRRRAAAGAQPEVHGKPALLRDQRGWGHLRRPLPPHRLWAQRPWLQRAPELMWGHPELLHLSHRLWAQPPDLRRAQRLISPPLLQDPCRGPGRGWPDTRRDAHWSLPRTSRLLRTRRRVSQSVVVVTVR